MHRIANGYSLFVWSKMTFDVSKIVIAENRHLSGKKLRFSEEHFATIWGKRKEIKNREKRAILIFVSKMFPPLIVVSFNSRNFPQITNVFFLLFFLIAN